MTTQNSDILASFQGIGFSKNEAAIYLANLELGPSTVWEISKKSDIKRPTCYVILQELAIKGLATSTKDSKRTIYSVSSPKQLQQTLERYQARFNATLPQLTALASKSPNKPVVRLYEGTEGVIQAYNLSLDQPRGSEILIYGTAEVKKQYGNFIHEYIEARTNRGISVRGILPDNEYNREILKTDKSHLRQTRFFPEEKFGIHTEINIFQDTIAYIAHSEASPFATVIENQTLADEEKQRFNLLWELGK